MSARNDDIIRAGDRCTIVDPEIFIRCGYNLTPAIAGDKLITDHEQKIIDFLISLGYSKSLICNHAYGLDDDGHRQFKYGLNQKHPAISKFMYGLSHLDVRANGFGGYERKIFTETSPHLEGAEVWVPDVRTVVTGDYSSGSAGYSTADYDVDPEMPTLENQVRHRIACIAVPGQIEVVNPYRQFKHGVWIEAKNLKKLPKE